MHEGQELRNSRARSLSGDFEDTDFESHAGDSHPPGKPGRKKNPNSQAARRDQNRIAQREFRLRKQQRIRDLEARVELLSGGKDEVMGEMRNMVKDLMAENQTLRQLLRGLATFIGEGAGGLLPKLGWEMGDFNNFVNKSETDTAWEGYQKRKQSQGTEAGSATMQSRKRAAEDPLLIRSKKARNDDINLEDRQNGFSLIVPVSQSSVGPQSLYSASTQTQERPAMFTELMSGPNPSQIFMQPSTSGNPSQYPPGSNINGYPPSYIPGVNMNMEQPMSASYGSPQGMQRSNAPEPPDEIDEEDDPKMNEARKLISYHLENYKRNSSYCLPASLRPTLVQRTIPHESFLDRILHPELRDRMILFRDRYDLLQCAIDLRQDITIHGDDVLAHSSWEIGEKFLRKYGFLIDTAVLKVSNRWRRERGEPELLTSDITGERSQT
ncbi:hypothetical protein BYT27DRAFT_7144145 [Phlegmacium glaucopus]|nr:hypothetical protein BYT27DRAFT_7144145 [Phlegmacium glaucopus]